MSRSSSTIRMSSAIARSPCKCRSFGGLAALGERVAGETQRDARSPAIGGGEGHVAAVLLDDLVDDREPEPGALVARRHIGLDDALAILRQAHAVVLDR